MDIIRNSKNISVFLKVVRVRKLSLLGYTSLCLTSTATATVAGLVDQIARALGAVAATTCKNHNPISRF
jgi:hypothetical protein